MNSRLTIMELLQILFLVLALFIDLGHAQPTTDPVEGRALNSIFRRWGISANERQWNMSGEVCSGAAVDDSTLIDNTNFNPFIKCDCSYQNSTTCHITQLKVYAQNVVGTIPDELWTLSYLTNLNLGQNYLTGPLSPSISNLTQMEWLNLGINALSGQLPRELGTLANLKSLGIGNNNFSGPLPREIGNCFELEQLYIDSSGVSGEIPPTFANLRNLATVWASDTELTGNVPAFIGNWSNLTSLRFQGNAFEGPIPSTFANLTSLTELRIGGLSNGSSSLAFIRNLRSLSILDLRDSEILDTIPSDIGEYQRLTQLDLSFNNITGPIPASLFNLSSLTLLFLGNNMLNGTLPAEKSSSLVNIDLSYNFLRGSLPSWVNQNLSLNLVANNFTIDRSSSSGFPSGLNCLQRSFPCNRGSGIYSSFAVKCGGPQITSSDRTVFERESEMLGPASYYVTDESRWAVSNVGYFSGTNNPQYTSSSTAQFTNTLDPELYQTARISASSLRYYGLGLQNGNYTVSLHFAETQFVDANRWQSLGRRIFDIYIQGRRVRKDFDIRNEAGGSSTSAVVRRFNTTVSENYLEVHLFWAGKGTCCVPAQGTYGPSISAISVSPGFRPTVRNRPNAPNNSRTGLLVGIIVGVGVVSCLAVVAFLFLRRRSSDTEDDELGGMDMKPYTFSYNELKTATEDFSTPNKLGEGGYGPVYKGKLNDGRTIAVKQLSVASRQGKSQFITEIATISGVQHRNLVKLYGCCIEADHHLLVYEYLENKSLDKALFDRSLHLDWPTRFDVCMGVARGLAYLHEESRLRIVHRDVKSSNILLDADLNPKISDFGLAKLYDDKMTHMSTRVAGTIGYLAPEYAMLGHLTEKTDVFAFGVVTLELVSGRPNSDSSLGQDKMYLLEWAWELHETDHEIDLVDPCLSEHDDEQAKRMIRVALLCTQASPSQRPAMSRVVAMLSGDLDVSITTTKPGYLTDWKFEDHLDSFSSSNKKIMSSGTSYYTNSASTMAEDTKGSSPILDSTMHVG